MVQQKWPRGRADLLPATAAESLSSISSSSPQNTSGYGRALGAPQLGTEPLPLGAQGLVVPPCCSQQPDAVRSQHAAGPQRPDSARKAPRVQTQLGTTATAISLLVPRDAAP